MLSPGLPVRTIRVDNIRWLERKADGDLAWPVPVDIANRATDLYLVSVSEPVAPGSLIRRREHRRTQRVVPGSFEK